MPLGLVGIGKIAREQHLPTLCGPCAGLFSLAATASRKVVIDGVPGFGDTAAMMAAVPGLKALSICTPPAGREAVVAQAIAAGCHVMIEKPPAATLGTLAALAQEARRAGVTLFASWHSREAAAVGAAREWLAGRRVDAARVHWLEDIRVWHPGQDWILDAGGFGVFDPGINAFSILTALLSEPVAIDRAVLSRPAGRQAPIAARVSGRSGDIAIDVALDFLHPGEPRWDIEFECGGSVLRLSRGGHSISIDGAEMHVPAASEYEGLYRRFAELIVNGTSDVDVAPLRMVADAMLVGQWQEAPPFAWEGRVA